MKITSSEVLSTGQTVALFLPNANTANFFSVNKNNTKKELGPYPAILTRLVTNAHNKLLSTD